MSGGYIFELIFGQMLCSWFSDDLAQLMTHIPIATDSSDLFTPKVVF
jgi:hypothetical protein